MSVFKPMLAGTVELDKLQFPVLASPKLDGIRCICTGGEALSRSLKLIPNAFVQSVLSHLKYDGLDGELIVGSPTSATCYRDTNSAVMSQKGEPNFTFYIFDRINDERPFHERFKSLHDAMPNTVVVPHVLINNMAQLEAYEKEQLDLGYEGVMLRSLNGKYKHGRSTVKEGILLKLKRFVDNEYEIVGFEEQMFNGNEATKDELGHTKRSSHKEGLVPKGTLGALVLKHEKGTFNCGTGFDDATRQHIWDNRPAYLGKLAKIKHFEIGVKDLPRFPVFISMRSPIDV